MKQKDIISLISKIREKVNREILAKLAEHGVEEIATSHGDIIDALLRTERMTMAEIADKIGKDKSTVTALVDKLVRLGYLTKSRAAEDSRVVYVSLTDKGNGLREAFEIVSSEILEMFYRGISESEKEELSGILNRIYLNF